MDMVINSIIEFISLALKLAVPIVFAAFAGTLSERAGVINLGLEGMMLIGAFAGALGSSLTGSPWIGVFVAILCGFLIGAIHALFCLTFRGQQIVVGVAVNLFAAGVTPLLCKIFWNKEGASETVTTFNNISIPILKDIPYIGKLFTEQSFYIFLMFIIYGVLWTALYKTKYGLRLRAIGDHPMGVQSQGINTVLYKYVAVIISGGIAALGGSFLSISQGNVFVLNMTAGRGFIGLAANIFGGWTPSGSLIASLFFSVVQSTRYYLIDFQIPEQFIQMIPYISTLFILIIFGKNSKAPESLGKIIDR